MIYTDNWTDMALI